MLVVGVQPGRWEPAPGGLVEPVHMLSALVRMQQSCYLGLQAVVRKTKTPGYRSRLDLGPVPCCRLLGRGNS